MRIAEFTFDRPRDIAWSAERARLLGSLAGLSPKRRTTFGKAVKEIVRHAIGQGTTGTIQFGLDGEGPQQVEAIIRYPHDEMQTVESEAAIRLEFDSRVDWRSAIHSSRGVQPDSARRSAAEGAPASRPKSHPTGQPLWQRVTAPMRCHESTQNHRTRRQSQICAATGRRPAIELDNLRSLNQTLELLALVASKTDNAVIILDSRYCVEWVNDSFVRMTGYEMHEVRAKPLIEIFFGDDLAE